MKLQGRLEGASFSTWERAEACPARVYYAKIARLPDPAGPAAQRGTDLHAVLERHVIEGDRLPDSLLRWRPELDRLKAEAVLHPELDVGLTRTWKSAPWEKAKIRAKLDLVATTDEWMTVIDYKTGRQYPGHEDQLELYGTLMLHLHPQRNSVTASDWYLDLGCTTTMTYHRDDHGPRLLKWKERMAELLARREWPAKRNPGCKWCPFNVRKGGPCTEGA